MYYVSDIPAAGDYFLVVFFFDFLCIFRLSRYHLYFILMERLKHLNFIDISMKQITVFRRNIPSITTKNVNNEVKKSPRTTQGLLSLAKSERGEQQCRRALNCSRVCPTGVYPARHIADIRRRLKTK